MLGAGHHLEEFVGDVVVEAVEPAEPEVALKGIEPAEERGEARAVAQVLAVGGDILGDEVDFAGAGGDEFAHLGLDGLH